jgi:hypothetical protein
VTSPIITVRASVNLESFRFINLGVVNNRYSPFDDVRNGTGKHLEAFGHLQGDHLGIILSDMVDSFVYLEGIIRGQLFNGIIELCIGENILRDLIDDGGGYAWF